MIGIPTFGMHDDRKYALLLLNNILGGPGMNSLLNVAIRERHGYAYTVESAVTLFSDSGLMTVYFGSDERYAKRCLNLVDRTLDSLASSTMRQRALDAAKKQYAGQLLVGSESLEAHSIVDGQERDALRDGQHRRRNHRPHTQRHRRAAPRCRRHHSRSLFTPDISLKNCDYRSKITGYAFCRYVCDAYICTVDDA